jgi:maltose/moltooligosaccharide transporter
MSTPHSPEKKLSLTAIWNISFGFLGIQFGWGLQMANMSSIYQYLGANESAIPLLWLAAPVTGLLVQPIVGHYSDRTWTILGRRKPYFLVGALFTSIALAAMPNASTLWMAAGLLWILDASVNISMEPFRAFVADLLPSSQRQLGFSMQSLLIGLGAVSSSALPWILTHFGLANARVGDGVIPRSVHLSFYIGAAVLMVAVLYTVFTTKETPPDNAELVGTKDSTFSQILKGLLDIPYIMKRLAVVQFFTWFALFCMWIYFSPAVARSVFGGTPGEAAYQRGVEWSGVCFATYNGVAFAVSFLLVALANRGFSTCTIYGVGLVCAGFGLLGVTICSHPELLIICMVGVGIGWATILSMPYALLSDSIPANRMGFYMGVFNFFIVLPQILAATVLGPIVEHFLGGKAIVAVAIGGLSFLVAALSLAFVPQTKARD